MRLGVLLLTLALVGLLSACTQFVDTVSIGTLPATYEVYGSRTLGQTFVCHHAGLNGISVLLGAQAGSGDVVLHLRESPESQVDLAWASASPVPGKATFHYFALPLQYKVNTRSLFLLIESPATTPGAAVVVPYDTAEIPGRQLYMGDGAVPGHLSYKLHYDVLSIARDVSGRMISYMAGSAWFLLASCLLYLLPGGALVVWLVRDGDWTERLVVATSLSVAVQALLVYATMTGLRLNAALVKGFVALCGALILARGFLGWRSRRLQPGLWKRIWEGLRQDPSPVALLLVFAVVLAVRIWVIRDLVAPMWGDSYQHAVIAQLTVDNGGLFASWAPYAPLSTFTYHFGFHANVALFHWLSGDPVVHSVTWVGQVLNSLAVLSLYPLTVRVGNGNRWAGVAAVFIAGLLSALPMYYVNWGRYTQLAGQVILPVLMWMTWRLLEAPRWDWRLGASVAVAVVALGLAHYRVVLFYGAFMAALGVVWLFQNWGKWRHIGQVALYALLLGCAVILLFLPWGLHTLRARLPLIGRYLIEQGNESYFHRQEYNAIGNISFYAPWSLLVLDVVALAWLSMKRQWRAWSLVLWVLLLLILANPYVVGLPGTGIISNFAVFIMLYIPLCVLGGISVGYTLVSGWHRRRWIMAIVLVPIVVLCVGYGLIQRTRDLDMEYAMVTRSDMEAMNWIRVHTPSDARFLVNGFVAYGQALVVGADAGWWIPLLAERQGTIPPITYGMELGGEPDYQQRFMDWFLYLQQVSPTSPEGEEFLRNSGVTHVYVGQGAGMVGNSGSPLLDVGALSNDPTYRLIYHRDGVWVFELTSATISSVAG